MLCVSLSLIRSTGGPFSLYLRKNAGCRVKAMWVMTTSYVALSSWLHGCPSVCYTPQMPLHQQRSSCFLKLKKNADINVAHVMLHMLSFTFARHLKWWTLCQAKARQTDFKTSSRVKQLDSNLPHSNLVSADWNPSGQTKGDADVYYTIKCV